MEDKAAVVVEIMSERYAVSYVGSVGGAMASKGRRVKEGKS
jgi:hypothetical protein